MNPIDWFALTSLCWIPLLFGTVVSWGFAKMLDALGLLEDEDGI